MTEIEKDRIQLVPDTEENREQIRSEIERMTADQPQPLDIAGATTEEEMERKIVVALCKQRQADARRTPTQDGVSAARAPAPAAGSRLGRAAIRARSRARAGQAGGPAQTAPSGSDPCQTVLLGVTGSIAAHRALDLTSELTKAGVAVDVVLTAGATRVHPAARVPVALAAQGLHRPLRAALATSRTTTSSSRPPPTSASSRPAAPT